MTTLWLTQVSRAGTRVERGGTATQMEGDTPPFPTDVLRILSLNLWHDFPRFWRQRERLELVAAEVRRQNVDVVCLQEAWWTPRTGSAVRYLSKRTGMEYAYLRANGNKRAILFEEGVAILSRYPLRDIVWSELQPRAGPFEHRVVLGATVGEVRIYVTHLTNGDRRVNHAQAGALQAFVEDPVHIPAVVVGDFNAPPESPTIRALTRHWVDAGSEPGTSTCCVNPRSDNAVPKAYKRIDYAFLLGATARECRPLWIQDSARDGTLRASDHAALLIEVCTQPQVTGDRDPSPP